MLPASMSAGSITLADISLERGQIAELGTHAELVAGGGRYAEMFRVQAERFAA
jgi:ABC-type transport system involved in Fe-S cluster assembly fused permease/ATPase subunit